MKPQARAATLAGIALLMVQACAAQATPPAPPSGEGGADADSGALQPFAYDARLIGSSDAGSPTPWQAFDGSNLVLYDVDGDGLPEIVGSNDNLRHYVIDPRSPRVLAEMATTHTGGDAWQGRELGGPAVGDAFGDGGTTIAIHNGDSRLSLWRYNASASTPTSFAMARLWEVHVNSRAWDPAFNATHPWNTKEVPSNEGHPFLADVDGTGRMTVFAQSGQVAAHAAFNLDGSRRWFTDPPVDSNAGAIVADLDGDGRHEVVYASEAGPIYVEDARTGRSVWTYDLRCEGGVYAGRGENCDWQQSASITLSPTVTDLTGDGLPEICFGARQTLPPSDPGWYGTPQELQRNVDASHAKLGCLRHDGTLLWMQQLPFGNPHSAMHPVPFDVSGDGRPDLLWLDWNSIGHRPGNWETTTRGANLMALDGRTGMVLWNTTVATGWSNQDISLADVYGDGRQVILVNEYSGKGASRRDGLSAIDPLTGSRLAWVPHLPSWVATRGPMVADVDGDGTMEIVVPVMHAAKARDWCVQKRTDLPCREGAIEVLSTGKPYSSAFRGSYTWSLPVSDPQLLSHPGAAAAARAMQTGSAGETGDAGSGVPATRSPRAGASPDPADAFRPDVLPDAERGAPAPAVAAGAVALLAAALRARRSR